jgi:hypothetical protein
MCDSNGTSAKHAALYTRSYFLAPTFAYTFSGMCCRRLGAVCRLGISDRCLSARFHHGRRVTYVTAAHRYAPDVMATATSLV